MILHDLVKPYKLILASQSPRRKKLLEGLDLTFEVIVRDGIHESYPVDLDMPGITEFLARRKSDHYTDLLDEKTILITADTIVWHKNKVLGKPANIQEAYKLVSRLSGNKHTVVTGVCLRSAQRTRVFHSISEVVFRKLRHEEIYYYVTRYKPLDKAGAYGIQEWIGYVGIEKIEGSFFNVMGLPVQMVYNELLKFVEGYTQ
ncbi:MAG: Maf family nucleotide pyrophosphatase [Bacteroidales bacterium]|jgi:septum formation protein